MQTNRLSQFLSFIIVLTFFVNISNTYAQQTEKFVVVIDAGHGGHDPGRPTKNGYTEKDIALKVALQVGKNLESNKNIKVIYTRKTDVFVTLRGRAKIANDADADLFVSIHCNANHTQAHGTETYVLGVGNTERNFNVAKAENEVIFLEDNYEKHYEGFDPNAPESLIGLTLMQEEYVDQSIMLADLVEKGFQNKLKRKSRGVKQISLWVLHNTYMPSVLIETGFITNTSEGKYLNSSKGQQEISKSISNAILDYKGTLDQNIGEFVFTPQEEFPSVTNEKEQIIENVVFKVQIAASSRKLAPKAYNFKGLDAISREKEGALYKYFHGYTSDFTKAKNLQANAKSKGYTSCFIVAFKDGIKITLDQALKTSAN
ncbi:N-acetylmuramoyl-L-alanine amidase [Oceanihabitans sp. 2_MG-2023]|uniref:N-acetylmuramoyl-L-alanine amidase family protein n=1 Tax=Oceanihabitans sp. 2_MG-2023 TaxID=3062661 RepID=UPI0026E1B253|nr:N-acetylmuramoyl-L-alanine amidase [Oceanihabitans sp. 2_MG-2023]MDO6598017.1 N-acetylmuramoyl-L-alanine amidase [Oceanihabitans sp. 2_MG-2023]